MFCGMESWDLANLDVQAHQPEVLASAQEGRLVAIELPAGEMLSEHQVHERAWLVVIRGEIEIATDGETMAAGHVMQWAPNERHEVRAKADSRLLLILSPWPGEGHPSAD